MKTTIFVLFLVVFAPFSYAQRVFLEGPTHRLAVMGDAGQNIHETRLVRNSMRFFEVFRLVMPGDNLYHPEKDTYESVWDVWRDRGFHFEITALGNHHDSYEKEMRYFKMPAEYFEQKVGAITRFIVLNSDDPDTVEEQMRFLSVALARAEEPVIFVMYHHPSFSVSPRHSWTEKKAFQRAVRPILLRHREKISGLIVGHDHVATVIDMEGIPMIVSGAAMEQFPGYVLNNVVDGVRLRSLWLYRGAPTWATIDIDDDKQLVWLNWINAANNNVECSIRLFPTRDIRDNCKRTSVRLKR